MNRINRRSDRQNRNQAPDRFTDRSGFLNYAWDTKSDTMAAYRAAVDEFAKCFL